MTWRGLTKAESEKMIALNAERQNLLGSYDRLGEMLNRLIFSDAEKERYWREQAKMKERADEIQAEMKVILETKKQRQKRQKEGK